MATAVLVTKLTKIFDVPGKSAKQIVAVDDISFKVEPGEVVGFIGPNGAGKSTTIKMLTGILTPTKGRVQVAGFDPQKQRDELVMKIGTVFGQRSQLVYNLPVMDSFELFSKLYELNADEYKKRRDYLFAAFDINSYLGQPVRKLSLGQRMKAEVALALLHRPEIVFLDEPTIGLDIVAKQTLRETLLKLNHEEGTTIFLTSHDIGDIESVTHRTMVVNHGRIVVDQDTTSLKNKYLQLKSVHLTLAKPLKEFADERLEDICLAGKELNFDINTKKYAINDIMKDILNRFEVTDIDINNPDLEDVIRDIYQNR
jgi:ABC-2 type transport system ATP-binding protein